MSEPSPITKQQIQGIDGNTNLQFAADFHAVIPYPTKNWRNSL
ncbi:MAG TPA: hypothetical protein VK536_00350 [Candidatus Limnocylindrales bacterium]|nr:hypothetical protein [Candidatus Limnocylindrales bacterium]